MKQLTVGVCDNNTRKFLKNVDIIIEVSGPPTKELPAVFDDVVAIGGGAVIDTAKMLSSKKLIVYPTTSAGAGNTSHSVVWSGTKKINVKRKLPDKVIVKKEYFKDLPEKIVKDTFYDTTASCTESLYSKKGTEESKKYAKKGLALLNKFVETDDLTYLIKAGNESGKAIEITGTNIFHSLSYPLTGIYKIPHGEALGYILKKMGVLSVPLMAIPDNIDWEVVIQEAFKYDKIKETTLYTPTKKELRKILL